ncbi:hypothetical protein SOCE26_078980 [Sorangium cellulosum]|uniref:Ferritin-like domain-containing protein n=1 Tax=Sorangium cellulosum TaxID=56 RepID=A0A2L0F4B8_SORCE|nr:hypothetical protein [Sorangium cellulosum]AUX46377.1 hypothetical protein SOCE26_078830 [Sorangium cellulosum]AUX46392.1 hypothetical protein SOCE26_078980 [Sorangium cellulosum]
MTTVAELTLAALEQHGTEPLPAYAATLRASCAEHVPPFGMAWYGDKYREVASDPAWLASSLIANAQKEGEGSRGLWQLAGRTSDADTSDQIRLHAIDESRHANMYLAMLDLVFPDAVGSDLQPALDELSPRYTKKYRPLRTESASVEHVLDELIQMNLGEIRTRIHQLLLRPMITAHCVGERREKLTGVLDSLILDETRHIEYTARLIERASVTGLADFVRRTMAARLREFNDITLVEVGEAQFVGE